MTSNKKIDIDDVKADNMTDKINTDNGVCAAGCRVPDMGQVYSGIGGQAVLEGMMMRNGAKYSVGVRKPDGTIEVMEDTYISMTDKYPICKAPFIRGIFSFVDSMVLGTKCLNYSATFIEDDPEDADKEPGKFEKWLDDTFGEKLEPVITGIVMFFSFALAMVLFVLFPAWVASFLKPFLPHESLLGFIEGIIRVTLFVIYIKIVSRTPDIARTFQYHGAEHKCINCVEHGLPLTVRNVAASSKEHKRCGTSFIVYVMLISILLFMVIRFDDIWLKLASRLVLIPVIAGISYEVLRIVGMYDNALTRLLFIPGMWMQGLTTSEPDDSEIEVAIAAVEKVFDWRKFEKDTFGIDFQENDAAGEQ
ncbi:putative metal-dependent enzyme [Lachnospiraceae bacterium JC7]|nr:putative metal-dependent enzyme [Lachnospiraceae bacterium JC7]